MNVLSVFTLEMRGYIFQSHFIPFPMLHSHSHSRSPGQPGIIPIPFPDPSVIPISSCCHSYFIAPVAVFMDTVKQTTCKLTTNERLLASKTIENQM